MDKNSRKVRDYNYRIKLMPNEDFMESHLLRIVSNKLNGNIYFASVKYKFH